MIIFIGGSKGGSAKTTTSHLLCLGAILSGKPAAYVLTDPNRVLMDEGRPYDALDGRDPVKLAQILGAYADSKGYLIVDGAGNMPAFDMKMAELADIVILPFRASDEDTLTCAADMKRIPQALAWPAAWQTNEKAANAQQPFIEAMKSAFPNRVVGAPIPFVNSVYELLGKNLDSPSTRVRSAAKGAFSMLGHIIGATMPSVAREELGLPM